MSPVIRNAIAGSVGLIAVLSEQTHGQTIPRIFGEGNASCGEFLRAADSEHKARPPDAPPRATYTREYLAFKSFAEGFLSGFNSAKAQDRHNGNVGSSDIRFERGMVWLEDYCRKRSLDRYFTAIFRLRNALAVKERQ
jgi:hypothetical protein